MLERATACIKAGARDRRKCGTQQIPPRASKRLLRQTFWPHDAGDLDLPPRAASGPTPPCGLSMRCDDGRLARPTRNPPAPTTTATDGMLLDCLYPPQALAYLYRASRQPWCWRKRPLNRLADGFVQAHRNYSSRSHSQTDLHSKTRKISAQERADESVSPERKYDKASDVDTFGSSARLRTGADLKAELAKELMAPDSLKSRRLESKDAARKEEESVASYAISPSDLDEEFSGYRGTHASAASTDIVDMEVQPAECLRHLRNIMTVEAYAVSTHDIRRAWRLYLSLPEREKQDVRLKEKLLVWLNARKDELADGHMITLYWSIPTKARTLTTYSTVAESFIRREAWKMLHAMHKEALSTIPNGQEISLQLFTHALHTSWAMLRHVARDHDATLKTAGQAHRVELLWVKVPERVDLIDYVPDLLQSREATDSQGRVDKQLGVRLSREAVHQATDDLLLRANSSTRLERILELLAFIERSDSTAHSFFHKLLTHLIPALGQHHQEQNVPGATRVREGAHQVISCLYWYYRRDKAANLHPDLMLIWLKHLTNRMATTDTERRAQHNVTASMVIEDWQSWHGQLSVDAVHTLISYSAHSGSVEALQRWTAYLNRRYPAYQEQKKAFWAQIYVYARLSNLSGAKKAFGDASRSARAHGDRLDLKCWNILLHAYRRADDLAGGMEVFEELVQTPNLVPDGRSFEPLINMLSRRGDINGVEDLLQQYDSVTQANRTTRHVNAQIRALTLTNNISGAERLLAETLPKVRRHEIDGCLTECFNSIIAKYASMRDLDATMRTYRRMKEENIYCNPATYRHLMQVLANFRQTNPAWALLTKGMPAAGFLPNAEHYRVAMVGFNDANEPHKAVMAHKHMLEKNIRQSLDTKGQLVRAKALLQRRKTLKLARKTGVEPPDQLVSALADLQRIVDGLQPRDVTNVALRPAQDIFKPTMWLLGGQHHFDAVKRLFQESKGLADKYGHSPWPTFRLSIALMRAMHYAKEYTQVEEYWQLVKGQADDMAIPTTVQDFVALRDQTVSTGRMAERTPPTSAEHDADDRAELGFVIDPEPTIPPPQSLLPTQEPTHPGPRPAVARRQVLSQPFRIYLASLAAQNRLEDAIKEATRLMQQGYMFDNTTWNRFIEYLAGSDPPLTLLAFTLMERYLIRNFPGWIRRPDFRYSPTLAARTLGYQYIRGRYLAQTELMPQYRTFIWLAKSLLDVRRRETMGLKNEDSEGNKITPHLQQYVGTIKQIREQAPQTWKAVHRMPRCDDKWQNRLLKGIGWDPTRRANQKRAEGDATLEEGPNVIDNKLRLEALSDEDSAFLADANVTTDASKANNPSSTKSTDASSEVLQSDMDAHAYFDDCNEDEYPVTMNPEDNFGKDDDEEPPQDHSKS